MSQLSNKITFTDEQAMLLDIATNFFREKSPDQRPSAGRSRRSPGSIESFGTR